LRCKKTPFNWGFNFAPSPGNPKERTIKNLAGSGECPCSRCSNESNRIPECSYCFKKITGFRDGLSKKEFGISGLCQKCQDETFFSEQDQRVDFVTKAKAKTKGGD